MDRELLDKYFNDQCSDEELEQVLDWFQTKEGQQFLEEDIDKQNERFSTHSEKFLYPVIDSERIFKKIQRHKKGKTNWKSWGAVRVASIVVMALMLSSLLYWSGVIYQRSEEKVALVNYVTAPGQQKVISLSDGTQIRLNENSKLSFSEKFTHKTRKIRLKGEAFFEVYHDENRPFVVQALGATIKDLGTKFNVKTDSVSESVEVAVIQGKVALKKEGKLQGTSAVLTRNHFGILRLSDSQITIEKGKVENYLSWINNRLVFDGQSLRQVSRQLERLYNVKIQFKANHLKDLNLTADFEKTNLRKVLDIISNTLDVEYKITNRNVIWMD